MAGSCHRHGARSLLESVLGSQHDGIWLVRDKTLWESLVSSVPRFAPPVLFTGRSALVLGGAQSSGEANMGRQKGSKLWGAHARKGS